MAVMHENSYLPYTYRTVHIDLTPDQLCALRPKSLGTNCGKEVFEEIGAVYLEE